MIVVNNGKVIVCAIELHDRALLSSPSSVTCSSIVIRGLVGIGPLGQLLHEPTVSLILRCSDHFFVLFIQFSL